MNDFSEALRATGARVETIGAAVIAHGDCLNLLRALPDSSVDSIVTDPPYGLGKAPDALAMLRDWLDSGHHDVKGAGFMGKCLHPDTDLLTDVGWKRVTDVTIGDSVASLSPDTGEVEYVEVVKRHAYDYVGELLSVGGRSAQQVVTPNHMVWTADSGLVRADELPRAFRLTATGRWSGPEPEFIHAGRSFRAKPFLRFLGMFLGDGYVCKRRNQPKKQDFVGLSVKKLRKVDAVRACLHDLGVKFTETKGRGRTAFYIYDAPLREWLRPLGGALEKYIPNNFLMLGPESLGELFAGLMETDGCIQRRGQMVYSTSSLRLAEDFQRLAFHLGRSATLSAHRDAGLRAICGNRRPSRCSESYRISVTRQFAEFWMERDGRGGNRHQPAAVQRMPYRGSVHCVTLSRNHVMLTRWAGRPVFTGNSWDSFVPQPTVWKEALRVLKPGGHLLAFAGTRTYDLMTLGLRIAGFEIRDCIRSLNGREDYPAWVYGSGFLKSLNVSRALDSRSYDDVEAGVPEPEAARQWQGWGTALKPAWEPVVVARKPLAGTVAENVMAHGTGALNIDGCRVDGVVTSNPLVRNASSFSSNGLANHGSTGRGVTSEGRWPANLVHDGSEEVLATFPQAPGQQGDLKETGRPRPSSGRFGDMAPPHAHAARIESDKSAARFFFCAKASRRDRNEGLPSSDEPAVAINATMSDLENADWQARNGNHHPTVKPTQLMRYLCRLVTPPGGIVLDPYLGSGSTGKAAALEGFRFVGFELGDDYFDIAAARIAHAMSAPREAVGAENPAHGSTEPAPPQRAGQMSLI